MVITAAIVVVLPVVLMVLFNGDGEADARGRRLSRRWHS
jgi:hypothetical protein